MSMKNSSDTIGIRTRDLPACSAAPQPTAPLRAPLLALISVQIKKRKVCIHISAVELKQMGQYFPFRTNMARKLSESFHSSLTGQRRKYCKQSPTQTLHLCGLVYKMGFPYCDV